jgi:hypothetical protein
VREAAEIVARRDAIHRDAEEEARLVVARAEEEAARLIESDSITRAARQRADQLTADAQARIDERVAEANADIEGRIDESRRLAEQQMAAADHYARELLDRLATQLEAFQRSVRSGIDQLEQPVDVGLPPSLGGTAAAAAARADEIFAAATANLDLDAEIAARREARGARPPEGSAKLGSLVWPGTDEGEPDNRPRNREPGVIDDFSMPPLDDQPPGEWRGQRDDRPERDAWGR